MSLENIVGSSWVKHMAPIFRSPYFRKVGKFLAKERKLTRVFPNNKDVFRCLRETPFSEVRVIVLGQDPYYTWGSQSNQPAANGLAFSVSNEYAAVDGQPESLKNIFKELEDDLGFTGPEMNNPDLSRWAKQGVLLLNTSLTVRQNDPGSHMAPWNPITKHILKSLMQERYFPFKWCCWGNHAQNVAEMFLDPTFHHIHRSVHPSPRVAHRGFFGSKPFSKINEWLVTDGETPIDW